MRNSPVQAPLFSCADTSNVLNKQDIEEQINRFLTQILEIDSEWVTPDSELKRDMGLTSVDAVAIASFVQKTFGCTIRKSDIRLIITLQDLYDFVTKEQQ